MSLFQREYRDGFEAGQQRGVDLLRAQDHRKWAIEQALRMGIQDPHMLCEAADQILNFITPAGYVQ